MVSKHRLILLVIFILLELLTDVRSRGTGSRSSGSVSSSGRSASGSRGGVARYSGLTNALASGIAVRGILTYNDRFSGHQNYDDNPTVCYSEKIITTNETEEALGYFVCPYEESDDIRDGHCCGIPTQETCCKYWENPERAAGTIAAIVIIAVGMAGIAFHYYSDTVNYQRKNDNVIKGI